MSGSKKKKKRVKIPEELRDTYKPCNVEIDMEECIDYSMGNVDIIAANHARVLIGLKPLEEKKERKCLKCSKMFMTTKSIRICCNKTNELPEGWGV